ncbi:MAG: DUF393 domain-containing protein [Simkaniaceae bacterium]|nr:DUF393 domain-containing protein [Candidatus Sacchlamyda saccharinae]
MNLIFFDSACPLCQRSVRKIQAADKGKIFLFYPLNSEKAKELLPEKLLKGDTIVLIENGKTWVRAQAVFRILGLLGSRWGWLVHVPGLNFFYRIIAHNRHLF